MGLIFGWCKMLIKRLKNSKPFCKSDIIIYAFIALVIALLFLFFIIIPARAEKNSSTGFIIEQNKNTILTYAYKDQTFKIEQDFIDYVKIEKNESGFTITIYSNDEHTEYNIISVDNTTKTVKMADTNCRSELCKYMHASDNGIIYCAPRALKISLIGSSGFTPAVTG